MIFSCDLTSYIRNLSASERKIETYAVMAKEDPNSFIFPTLIVTNYCDNPVSVARKVAEILTEHWTDSDEKPAPPPQTRKEISAERKFKLMDCKFVSVPKSELDKLQDIKTKYEELKRLVDGAEYYIDMLKDDFPHASAENILDHYPVNTAVRIARAGHLDIKWIVKDENGNIRSADSVGALNNG